MKIRDLYPNPIGTHTLRTMMRTHVSRSLAELRVRCTRFRTFRVRYYQLERSYSHFELAPRELA